MKLKIALAATLLLSPLAHAQTGGAFNLNWSTTDGGGGTSHGGSFAVSGTCGQPDAGTLTGGQFQLEGGYWSRVQVLQVPGSPTLKLRLVGATAILSWPVSLQGFTLQEAAAPTGAPWAPTPQPVTDTTDEHTVTVPANRTMKVFRLKK